ncbi:MAG: hypothetical protein AYL32_005000 [Candidatus Bathyarchaeota archaeon B26-2]|nr:MAG: hypothetical protein AYL32_005000 [Candidatus Bathyarchaeota archaeon B26-2]
MDIHKVLSVIDGVRAEHVLILCHHNADPDAVCSAYAFKGLLRRLRPKIQADVRAPGLSRLSKALLESLSIDISVDQPRFEDVDVIVMVDTNTIKQLGPWGDKVTGSGAPLIFIDHHASHPETEKLAEAYISDEEASSTCEIVYGFYRELGLRPASDEAKALFLGISFDTKHFILATSRTFRVAADLVEGGVDAQEALSLLALPMDPSERIARLKACQRLRLLRLGEWIVALTHIGAYQASAARALIDMGAHLTVVAGEKDGEVQVSLRSSREFYEKTGIHLGRDVAKPLGERLRGMGGGHSTSAGVNGFGTIEEALKEAERVLKEKLVA